MTRGSNKQQQRSQQRLAQANREAPYRQDCGEMKPTLGANLRQCEKAHHIKECCIKICRCASSREAHAAMAFNTVRGTGEDNAHQHFREVARSACNQCLGSVEEWIKKRPAKTLTPKTPKKTRTPVRRTETKSARNSYSALRPSPLTTPASGQHSVIRALGLLDLSGNEESRQDDRARKRLFGE